MTREELHAAMGPELVSACEALKAKFGVKPIFIQTPTVTVGIDLDTDEGWRKYRTRQSIQTFMESQRGE